MTQQLFLNLSSGPVPSTQIRIVNLDTYHMARCSAVAVWLRDQDEPLYFAHGTPDALAVKAWAETQLGEQFLALPGTIGFDEMTHYFAQDLVDFADIDDENGGVYVKLKGDPRFWWFSPQTWAASVLQAWQCETDTAPRAIALAS